MHFVDNDSVKDAVTKGNTLALASLDILSAVAREEVANNSCTWYSRVPSQSNISDGPSRGCFEALVRAGFTIRMIDLEVVLSRHRTGNRSEIMSSKGL